MVIVIASKAEGSPKTDLILNKRHRATGMWRMQEFVRNKF